MKKSIQFVLFILLISCSETAPEQPFVGKWAFLADNDYLEAHITSDTIYSYMSSMGIRYPIHFIAKGDSLHYCTNNMAVRYTIIADSVMVISNSDFSDTLFKLDESIVTYDEIDLRDTVAILEYRTAFYNRSQNHYRYIGYKDSWDYIFRNHKDTVGEIVIIK